MWIFFLLFSTKNISKSFFKNNYFSTFSKFYVKYYVTDWLLAPPQGISKWLVGFKSIKKRSKYLWCPQNSVSSIIWKCTRREIQLEISFSKNPFQYFLVANQYVFIWQNICHSCLLLWNQIFILFRKTNKSLNEFALNGIHVMKLK